MKKMWLEKGALAIAVILLCLITLKAVNSAEPAEKIAFDAKLQEMEAVLSSDSKIELPKIDYLERLQKAWMTLPPAPEMSNSLMYKNTIHTVTYQEAPKEPLPIILPPAIEALKVNSNQPDTVVIFWGPSKSTATVIGYKLYRKAQDEQVYKFLAELSADAENYTDAAIQPETTYEYYLTSLTKDKAEGGNPESAPSGKLSVLTPEIAYPDCDGGKDNESGVNYNNMTGKFTVRIKKYAANGKIVFSKQFNVQEGDKIEGTNYTLSKVEGFIDTSAGFPKEYKILTFTNNRTNKPREAKVRAYK
ncbi:MAG: fibronectin type III domain-containing protein [Planctomycetes bacterium]|nr:fibronectin type III domain-containing protein [Planctomycetota bacterium]